MASDQKPLRHIKIFSTPAGTPSSSYKQGTRPGNHLPLPFWAQHWGILVEDEGTSEDARNTFFELNRPDGGIDVLKRSRSVREAEERANSTKMVYHDTGRLTTWNDDEIESCGMPIFLMIRTSFKQVYWTNRI